MSALYKIPCTVEILTRNCGKTLERCLESVKEFAEIIVLDGNSTDGTLEIARRYGCRIVKQYETDESNVSIKDYSDVRNKGLRLATYDWFMFIDSDEYLSPEAVEEIRKIITNSKPSAYVWWQPRKYVLDGKVIECATTYPNQQIRFFHKAWVKEFIKPIHERIEVKPGVPVGTLRSFEYLPVESLPELDTRWRRYMKKELEMMGSVPSPRRVIRAIVRNGELFGLYAFRYPRNLFLCRGLRMPLAHEWTRHKYLLIAAGKLVHKFFTTN